MLNTNRDLMKKYFVNDCWITENLLEIFLTTKKIILAFFRGTRRNLGLTWDTLAWKNCHLMLNQIHSVLKSKNRFLHLRNTLWPGTTTCILIYKPYGFGVRIKFHNLLSQAVTSSVIIAFNPLSFPHAFNYHLIKAASCQTNSVYKPVCNTK